MGPRRAAPLAIAHSLAFIHLFIEYVTCGPRSRRFYANNNQPLRRVGGIVSSAISVFVVSELHDFTYTNKCTYNSLGEKILPGACALFAAVCSSSSSIDLTYHSTIHIFGVAKPWSYCSM